MRPWSMDVRLASARSSVLLPLPDGPNSTKNSPDTISSETSLTTGGDWASARVVPAYFRLMAVRLIDPAR